MGKFHMTFDHMSSWSALHRVHAYLHHLTILLEIYFKES